MPTEVTVVLYKTPKDRAEAYERAVRLAAVRPGEKVILAQEDLHIVADEPISIGAGLFISPTVVEQVKADPASNDAPISIFDDLTSKFGGGYLSPFPDEFRKSRSDLNGRRG